MRTGSTFLIIAGLIVLLAPIAGLTVRSWADEALIENIVMGTIFLVSGIILKIIMRRRQNRERR